MQRDVVGQKLAAAVTGMDAVAAGTFEFKLSEPCPAILFSLGSSIGRVPVVMRAKDLAGDPTKAITTAIGSSPFRFNKKFLPLLERNQNIQLQRLTELSNQTVLRLNSMYPPFNDLHARLVLAYIIDHADVMPAGRRYIGR